MTMYNYRVESEVSGLRGEVVFIGAAIVTALLVNAYILLQMANDLHCLKEMEKEKLKSIIPPGEDELTATTEAPVEQAAEKKEEKEAKTESETKSENEKQ